MDINTTQILKDTGENFLQNGVYDILKFTILFILYKVFERLYLKSEWGDWEVRVYKNYSNDKEALVTRKLSIQSAKQLHQDEGEMSRYLKGLVSPFAMLTLDIVSEEAKEKGLYKVEDKKIIIDLSKNSPKKNVDIK
jgi:hypothetical protein